MAGGGLISDQAHIGGGVALVGVHTVGRHPVAQGRGKGLAGDQRFAQARKGHAQLLGFFQNDFQKAGRTDVAGGLQLGHGADLLLGLAGATSKHGATQRVGTGFHHGARRREVVAKAVVDQFATAKPGGEQRACHAPVVSAPPLGLVNRAGAGKHARHGRAKTQSAKATKHIAAPCPCRFLLFEQGMFANYRKRRQGLPRGNGSSVNLRQRLGKRRGLCFGMRNVRRQGGKQGCLARVRGTVFQRVVMV